MPLKFEVSKDTRKNWEGAIAARQERIDEASSGAMHETVSKATQEGWRDVLRANAFLAAARNNPFLENLRDGLRVMFTGDTGEPGREPKAVIFHKMPRVAQIFEHGGTIEGKPLLWIPTERGAPPPGRSGKNLVSATVRGQPMLFDKYDRDRHRKPLYVGVRQVRVKKTFRLTEKLKEYLARFSQTFSKHFKAD